MGLLLDLYEIMDVKMICSINSIYKCYTDMSLLQYTLLCINDFVNFINVCFP